MTWKPHGSSLFKGHPHTVSLDMGHSLTHYLCKLLRKCTKFNHSITGQYLLTKCEAETSRSHHHGAAGTSTLGTWKQDQSGSQLKPWNSTPLPDMLKILIISDPLNHSILLWKKRGLKKIWISLYWAKSILTPGFCVHEAMEVKDLPFRTNLLAQGRI